jgi:hypothetical protein
MPSSVMTVAIPSFPLMSSSKCCIALHVQGLFHIARCKSGIVPAPHAEALEDHSELMTDSASRVVDLDLRLVGYFAAVAEHRHFGRARGCAARRAAIVEPADPPSRAADRRPPV